MTDQPFTFAVSSGEPDREFGSLAALARFVVSLRGKCPRLADGGLPELVARDGQLARSDLPGGHMVSIRVQDGSHAPHGALLGYVLMPARSGYPSADRVMAAIVEAQAPARESAA